MSTETPAVAFQKDGLNHQASLPQPQRRLVQQLLPVCQCKPGLTSSHRSSASQRPTLISNYVQQDDGRAIQACQHRSVVERQIGSRTSVERNQDS